MKVKAVNMDGLSNRQKATMKKHSVHHTLAHMKYMVALMRKGQSFTQAHKITMKNIGK
tara:strand:- start:338 stop:511 length:174 start_codon:yes stop_codon:yes gene_type:complete